MNRELDDTLRGCAGFVGHTLYDLQSSYEENLLTVNIFKALPIP